MAYSEKSANIIDYIYWRGDLDFSASPLNEVDALILCQLSYLDFYGIAGGGFETVDALSLREVAKCFFSAEDYGRRSNVGALINPLTVELLRKAADSRRFGSLSVSGFAGKTDFDNAEQFCAMVFSFAKGDLNWHFVAYRGTDDTIVGWREDFNLGYMERVPAQEDALAYLKNASAALRGELYLGGHSKGGNPAIYAGTKAGAAVQDRIRAVFNNDGPGFPAEFFEADDYRRISGKVRTFVPRLSIVGMLFSNPSECTIVANDLKNMIMQHDPFSWNIAPTSFAVCEDLGDESKFVGKTINEWFSALSNGEKKLFVETLFSVLEGSNVKTNCELKENWLESLLLMKKSLDKFSPETKEAVGKNIQLLFKIMFDEFAKEKLPRLSQR